MVQGSAGWARSSVVVTTKKRIKDDSNKIFLIFSSVLLVKTFYKLYPPPFLVVTICDCHQWYILSRLLDKFAVTLLLTVYMLVIWCLVILSMSLTKTYPPPPNSRRIKIFKQFNRIKILWINISLKLFQWNSPLPLAEVFL